MRALWAVSLFAGAALAQISVAPPQVGFMLDHAGNLRPVYGVGGNFLTGDPVVIGVVSAAFSGSSGFVKTGSTLLEIDRKGLVLRDLDVPDGPALFAFSLDGGAALAYLAGPNILIALKADHIETVAIESSAISHDRVLSITAPDSQHAEFIVQRADGLWDVLVSLADGAMESQIALTGLSAPVLLTATKDAVYSDENGIVLRKTDGTERHIATQLPGSIAFQQLGEGWIQVRDLTGDVQLAVRITEGREQCYRLPEAEP